MRQRDNSNRPDCFDCFRFMERLQGTSLITLDVAEMVIRTHRPSPPPRIIEQVWLRRLSVVIAKQEAIATLVRVPLVTRQAAMGVAVFGEGEGSEGGGAGYTGVRVAAAEADCRCLGVVAALDYA